MAKFHIAKDGKPAECKAHSKACPLGEATPHGEFESPEEATAWAEAVHAKSAGGTFSKNKKVAPAEKLYELPDVRLPYLEEGESIEETGWVVQQMLTEEGRIDEQYIDENVGFPESFRNLVFEKQPDGTYIITGPEEPLEAWMNEDEEPGELREATEKASVLPEDLTKFSGTPFEKAINFELGRISTGDNGRQKIYRSAPTYNITNAEQVEPELWGKLSDEAEAEYLKVEEERRGYAEKMRKSNAYFPPIPSGSREADLKARQLKALSVNARNAAYIASERKFSNGEVLKPGEVLLEATFDKQGNLIGYGEDGTGKINGKPFRFTKASSKRGDTIHGVVAVKGRIEKGQVVPASERLQDARVLAGSTSVNISADNPIIAPVESWTLGKGTPHGVVQGQAYFRTKPLRNANGYDSFVPEY